MSPAAKITRPKGVNSNIPNGSCPCCSAIELTRMLVEVPRSVQTPPNIEANESGISSFEGLTLMSLASESMTGMKTATAAVLLAKAETAPTKSIIETSAYQKLRLPSRTSNAPTELSAPVFDSAALRTNIAPTVTVAGLLKPANPSPGETMPLNKSVAITINATTS